MNWRPSEGLKRAEPLTQQILASAAAIGQHITDPSLRHRIVQLLADELDRALADGQGMGALPVRDVSMDDLPDLGDPSQPNGDFKHVAVSNLGPISNEDYERLMAAGGTVAEKPAKKRRGGRGRPKGAKNKAKPAEATT